jgi:hypothetical protein
MWLIRIHPVFLVTQVEMVLIVQEFLLPPKKFLPSQGNKPEIAVNTGVSKLLVCQEK